MLLAHPRSYFIWPLLTAASIPTTCTATVTWPGWRSGSGSGPRWGSSPSARPLLSSEASMWPRCRSTNSAAQVRVAFTHLHICCYSKSACPPPFVPGHHLTAPSPPGQPCGFFQALSCVFTFPELASRFPGRAKAPLIRSPSPSRTRIIVALNSLVSLRQTENARACGCGAARF